MQRKLSIILALALFAGEATQLFAQGTAFTYQGRLNAAGSPANGTYDFTFSLFTINSGGAAFAGPVTNAATVVSNGLFTTLVDLGPAFTGSSNWLEIAVRTNGTGGFNTLSPRDQVTPTPYAISAGSVSGGINASQLTSGVVPTNVIAGFQSPLYDVLNGGQGNTTTASYGVVGGGQNNTANNTYAVVDGGFGNTAGYQADVGGGQNNTASGQQSTVPGGNNNLASGNDSFAAGDMAQAANQGAFVWSDAEGTPFRSTNNNSFNVRASGGVFFATGGAGMELDGVPVLTISSAALGISLLQNASGAPDVIEGSQANFVTPGVIGATISGGGATNYFGFPYPNAIECDFASVGGGFENTILSYASASVISGGEDNSIYGDLFGGGTSVVAGGYNNIIWTNALGSTISGGQINEIYGDAEDDGGSVIGGGGGNTVSYNAPYSVIGGGDYNTIAGAALDEGFSVIAGGDDNEIYSNSQYSVIGGGMENTISGNTPYSVIGGGDINVIESGGGEGFSIIAGGYNNVVYSNSQYSVIGGGQNNWAGYYSPNSTIGGGANNEVDGNYATVPGGVNNQALGYASFAAGDDAQTTQGGTFIWADAEGGAFSATGPNQFLIRANGGVGIGTAAPQANVDIVSSNGIADPQLRLVQENGSDYSRLRFQTGNLDNWDVAVGGSDDQMNWFVPGYGNVMTLQTNGALTANSLTTGTIVSGGLTTGGITVNNDAAVHVSGAGVNTKTAAFIQMATAGNIEANYTIINNTLCNGNPNAILIVTSHWASPPGLENHVLGVSYGLGASSNQWAISNQDGNNIDLGAEYNVLIILP